MATTKRYLVKDAATGRQIWHSTAHGSKRKYALRKTQECQSPWNTNESAWCGDMARAKQLMERQYGKPVILEESGTTEYFPI